MNPNGLDISDATFQTMPRGPASLVLGALLALTLMLCARAFLRTEQVVSD